MAEAQSRAPTPQQVQQMMYQAGQAQGVTPAQAAQAAGYDIYGIAGQEAMGGRARPGAPTPTPIGTLPVAPPPANIAEQVEQARQERVETIIQTKPELVDIQPSTSGRYQVKVQLEGADKGVSRVATMTGSELSRAGYEIPQDIARRQAYGETARAQGILAAEREEEKAREYTTQDRIAQVSEEFGISESEVKRLANLIINKPDSPEAQSSLSRAGGIDIENKSLLVWAIKGDDYARYYDPVKDWKQSVVQVGIDKSGEPQYISKATAEIIEKESPNLYEVLERKGIEAYSVEAERAHKAEQTKLEKEYEAQNKKWLDENIYSDDYLAEVARNQGVDKAVEAWEKRQQDLEVISERQLTELRQNDPYMWGILTNKGKGVTAASIYNYEKALEKRGEDIASIKERQRQSGVEQAVETALTSPQTALEKTAEIAVTTREIFFDTVEAERALNTFIEKVHADNPDMSGEDKARIIEKSPEYKEYQRLLQVAEDNPDWGTQTLRDIGREALSFGAVATPTYNRKDIERQYDQQKEITLATFLGDRVKLKSLYDEGYFGEGDYAKEYYDDSLKAVGQQERLLKAVGTGDISGLQRLQNEGYFDDNPANYENIVAYVQSGGRELAPVTEDDINAVSESFGTKEEYVKSVMDVQPTLGELSKDLGIALVPVWGTMYLWDKMGGGMRGVSIATDVLSFVPIVGGIAAAAKISAGVGRAARVASAFKVVPKLAVAELVAPATSLMHPIETFKAFGRLGKSGVNWLINPRGMPMAGMSSVYSTTRLDTSILGDTEATKFVRDKLMTLQAAGEKPIVQFGDKVFTLRSGSFWSEGGVAHASPNIRFVEDAEGFTVATKTYPEGHPQAGQRMPESEQGLFIANVALERFTISSAFGLERFSEAGNKIKALNETMEQAKALGDVKKANKFNKLINDYDAAIKARNINKLDNVENKIIKELNNLAVDEVVGKINTSLRNANERYMIGDIKGAQEAMQEAIAYEKSLKEGRPGFAIWSTKSTKILAPTEKTYVGMVFKPKFGEYWEILATEMKQDKAAKLLQEAADYERLGVKKRAAELTQQAHDMIKEGKTGFRRVETAEIEMKFPELAQMEQMKPRYTTISSEGTKLYIYTDKPYSLAKVIKQKLLAPIDVLRNIFEPAIKVKTIPMTRAQRLAKIEELLAEAARLEKAGDIGGAKILKAEARVLEQSIKAVVKGVAQADDVKTALARADKMDNADELIQASRRAESAGDYRSADRLMRRAEEIAGRRYVRSIVRRAGTVSGLAEYARATMLTRLSGRARVGAVRMPETRRIARRADARRDTSRIADTRRVDRLRQEARRGETTRRTERAIRELDRRLETARVIEPRRPEARRGETTREGRRVGETPRTPEIPREPRRAGEERRTPEIPRTTEPTRTPEISRIPERGRIPRTGRIPKPEIIPLIKMRSVAASPAGVLIPDGSITWASGSIYRGKGKGRVLRPVWYYIPPPYNMKKPIPLSTPPHGAKYTGSRSPYETIQIIGRSRTSVPREVRVDLGWTDITVLNGKEIKFKAGGTKTDVGKRLESPTVGMSIEEGYGGVPIAREMSRSAMSKKKPERKVKPKRKRDEFEDIVGIRGLRL